MYYKCIFYIGQYIYIYMIILIDQCKFFNIKKYIYIITLKIIKSNYMW